LRVDIIPLTHEDYCDNQQGAKVYFDIRKQPLLYINDNGICYEILSVGFAKEFVPVVTVKQNETAFCYRLPNELTEWATSCVAFANAGTNMFPAKVVFAKSKNRISADIL